MNSTPVVIEQFGEMLLALLRRTSPPSLVDPTKYLDLTDDPRCYPAALLVALCGPRHPRYEDAVALLWGDGDDVRLFFANARDRVHRELAAAVETYPELYDSVAVAAGVDSGGEETHGFDLVWDVLFPEGSGLAQDWEGAVARLRRRRRVEVTEMNRNPISDPVREVLFTSNLLLGPGDSPGPPDHWYDHPVPLDDPCDGELAHGLRELDIAVAFELARHPGWRGPATLVLSVSSTHDGFGDRGRALVEQVIADIGPLENLRVLAFDETTTRQLWDEVIVALPAPGKGPVHDAETIAPVFGVSGPYGRHYSFLKAIAALWSVCIDGGVKATFKIDLDQSFPQSKLVAETGQSAFEHLTTRRWGARGRAATGETVDLVMIAGGLVNQSDIDRSVFTPDIERVPPGSSPEHTVFFSRLPQVLSTEAEIVSRYDTAAVDGVASAQERIHVTGGTSGILVAGLRRWRLFTPSVFGRAEDQAYLVSGLGGRSRPAYVHEPGLVMSHDKARLIPSVIRRGAGSKHIGDLLRTRLFSKYVTADHKRLLDPFTGCFVSRLPVTVTTLRFVMRALDPDQAPAAAGAYVAEGVHRLQEVDGLVTDLDDIVGWEREQWDVFYDSLDAIEGGLGGGEQWAVTIRAAARRIVAQAEIGRGPTRP